MRIKNKYKNLYNIYMEWTTIRITKSIKDKLKNKVSGENHSERIKTLLKERNHLTVEQKKEVREIVREEIEELQRGY